jgi:hypothetical protein
MAGLGPRGCRALPGPPIRQRIHPVVTATPYEAHGLEMRRRPCVAARRSSDLSPAQALIEIARDERAEMILVGATAPAM